MSYFKQGLPALHELKAAIRSPYVWPGGYPLHAIMSDGETLCLDAAKECWREIVRATLAGDKSGWQVAGVLVNWEDPALYCAHSNKRIESAYAEDDPAFGDR